MLLGMNESDICSLLHTTSLGAAMLDISTLQILRTSDTIARNQYLDGTSVFQYIIWLDRTPPPLN